MQEKQVCEVYPQEVQLCLKAKFTNSVRKETIKHVAETNFLFL